MNFPGTAEVGSKIISIGRSSFVVGQGIFMGETCYSTAESVIVVIDENTKRSTPMSEEFMQVLRELMQQH
jgi:acyl-CoA thioester hydrolase